MGRSEIMASWGFVSDPFVNFAAEKEDRLEQSFVTPYFFDEIVSDPKRPQAAFIFGARGEGKSALCKMVAQRLRAFPDAPLVVEATDFSGWDVEAIDSLTFDDHLRRILGACVAALAERLEQQPRALHEIEPADRALLEDFVLRFLPSVDHRSRETRLVALLDHLQRDDRRLRRYGGQGWRRTLGYLRRKRFEFEEAKLDGNVSWLLAALMLVAPGARSFQHATLQNVFDLFVGLVRRLGLPSVYVLVDKLDEVHGLEDRPDRIAKLVAPLAKSVRFLESEGAGIKLFIPAEARMELVGIRSDRIRTRTIHWDDAALLTFLKARVIAYSDGKLTSLEPVFTDYSAFEAALVRDSAGTPRNMLHILDEVVSEHCQRHQPPPQIEPVVVRAGLRRFHGNKQLQGDNPLYHHRIRERDT